MHGFVDGFSLRILWLEVGSTNYNPNVIVEFFLSTVQQLGGVPRVVLFYLFIYLFIYLPFFLI